LKPSRQDQADLREHHSQYDLYGRPSGGREPGPGQDRVERDQSLWWWVSRSKQQGGQYGS
jgi:hypothetical protein